MTVDKWYISQVITYMVWAHKKNGGEQMAKTGLKLCTKMQEKKEKDYQF